MLCFTATAKPDVVSDIVDYFSDELDLDLKVFDGGSHRPNLEFAVVKTAEGEKFEHTYQIISADLLSEGEGGAIVYCSTRRRTQEMAEFLQEKGVSAGYYHGGLSPELKKDAQEGFIDGHLQVIAATNAFGMGIDKPDVRLVIHADIPARLRTTFRKPGAQDATELQRAACCSTHLRTWTGSSVFQPVPGSAGERFKGC